MEKYIKWVSTLPMTVTLKVYMQFYNIIIAFPYKIKRKKVSK